MTFALTDELLVHGYLLGNWTVERPKRFHVRERFFLEEILSARLDMCATFFSDRSVTAVIRERRGLWKSLSARRREQDGTLAAWKKSDTTLIGQLWYSILYDIHWFRDKTVFIEKQTLIKGHSGSGTYWMTITKERLAVWTRSVKENVSNNKKLRK